MGSDERLVRLLAALRAALADLERYSREVSYDRLVRDGDAFRMVCHALQVALQASIDIGQLFLAREGSPVPDTYRQTFLSLGDFCGLPADLAKVLAQAAGLRNALVHVYTELDLQAIHQAYTSEREALRSFASWAAARIAVSTP